MLKEAMDVIALAEELAQAVADAKADGKVDWHDLPEFAPVVQKARDAVKGSSEIVAEFEGATSQELVEFCQKALAASIKLLEAVVAVG